MLEQDREKLPYWQQIPEDIKRLPREMRLRWHTQRYDRMEPVYNFVESLDTGLYPDEIRRELEVVRAEIKRIKGVLYLMQSDKFRDMRMRLAVCISNVKIQMLEQGRLELSRFKQYSTKNSVGCRLDELKYNILNSIKEARLIENTMEELCEKLGVPVQPYLRMDHFTRRSVRCCPDCFD